MIAFLIVCFFFFFSMTGITLYISFGGGGRGDEFSISCAEEVKFTSWQPLSQYKAGLLSPDTICSHYEVTWRNGGHIDLSHIKALILTTVFNGSNSKGTGDVGAGKSLNGWMDGFIQGWLGQCTFDHRNGIPGYWFIDHTFRDHFLTLTVLVTTIDAQWEGMGDVGSARYEPALLPPYPTIRVLSYSN